jgi:zinc protease
VKNGDDPTMRWWVAVCLVLLSGLPALSCRRTPTFAITHREQRGALPSNGLRFVIMPDPTTSLVEVAVRYDVGSGADPAGKGGLAHLVEHLMFDVRPEGETRSITSYLHQVALGWNAYTNSESTHYMTLGAAGALDSLLQLEAMRLYYGCTTIPEDEFAREREVVRNEIRQRRTSSEAQLEPALSAALYPAGHPYAHSVGGTDEELAQLTLADACAFMTAHYAPERATLVIAGGVEVSATVAAIEKWFGRIARGTSPAPPRAAPVDLDQQRRTIDLDIDRPVVAVSWALPPTRSILDEATRFAIAGRLSDAVWRSRMYEAAVRGGLLELGGHDAPVVTLLLELEDLDKVDDAVGFVLKAAGQSERPEFENQDDVRSRLKASFVIHLERLESRANDVADLVQFRTDLEFASARPYVFAELDAIDRVDLATAESRAKEITRPEAAQVTVFRPTRTERRDRQRAFDFAAPEHVLGGADVDPADARKRLAVTLGADPLADAKRFTLDNGIAVVLLPNPDAPLPIVSVQLSIGAGDASSPDHPLVPTATARFAMPPPKSRYVLGRAGIDLDCRTTPDHTICDGTTISIYLPELVTGLERTLHAGEYDQRALEDWQKLTGDMTARRRQREEYALVRAELDAIFGADHPYAKTGVRAPGAEKGVGRDRLLAFRDAHYRGANTTLVVTGAFDAAQAESSIREAFGGWAKGVADPVITDPPAARTGPVHVGITRDAGPQASIAISFPSPPGIDGQQAARLVVTEMVRDVASDVRSTLGATYGVSVRREERRGPTRYELRTSVDAHRSPEVLKALRDGLAALRAGDGFDAVFVRSRRRVVERLLAESTVSSELANRLGTLARFGLRPEYYRDLLRQVAALSTAQAKDILTGELAEAGEVIVVMADEATVTATFASAGLADATVTPLPGEP